MAIKKSADLKHFCFGFSSQQLLAFILPVRVTGDVNQQRLDLVLLLKHLQEVLCVTFSLWLMLYAGEVPFKVFVAHVVLIILRD